jgi:predicted 3-demethylubiquinone-9 3-methyltransferase (glyoxalase superfamily)
MRGITPNLWFDSEAEEAAKFYCEEVFDDAEIGQIMRYPESAKKFSGKEPGSVMTVAWRIGDTRFVGINGGPQFKFDEAVSFEIRCEDQAEVDYYWEKLTADGGSEGPCGWCKDKYGLSWQVVPEGLNELLSEGDQEKIERATAAMFQMRKLDIAELRRAAEGEGVPAAS